MVRPRSGEYSGEYEKLLTYKSTQYRCHVSFVEFLLPVVCEVVKMAYDNYGKRQRMDGSSYGMAPPPKRVCSVEL